MSAVRVCLEVGRTRTFASALDWPGWCRAGKGPEPAIEALLAHAERYAPVAALAGYPMERTERLPTIVEQLQGDATTSFGAPSQAADEEQGPVDTAAATRLAALVQASWMTLTAVVAGAPETLRKGPRGGGRDRDKMVEHVVGAEFAYARKVGVRHRASHDPEAVAAMRRELATTLGTASAGGPLVPAGWVHRYAARRIAWHVLDHAWEIEDRAER